MRYVMIIPAKGYSSRLPGKNLRPFCGHPLVAWSIVQGVYAKHVDEVWVSTDSDEVREVAESYGANVMMRNYVDELDTPGGVPVHEWVNRMVASGDLHEDDMTITRLCTTPTLLPHDTDRAIETFEWLNKHYDIWGLSMASELRTHHTFRKVVNNIGRKIDDDAGCENNYQVVEILAFFGMLRVKDMIAPSTLPDHPQYKRGGKYPIVSYYNVLPWQMQDVDTESEFEFAELVADHFILKGRDMVEVYKSENRITSVF